VLLMILCIFALAASACVYRTTSRGRSLHGSVAVPFLDNRTGQPDLELTVTDAIIEALERDGSLTVVGGDEADFLLTGAVTRYTEAPFSIGEKGRADEYKLSVAVVLTFRDQGAGEDRWQNKGFTGSASFYLEGSGTGIGGEGQALTRDWAESEALKQIVEDVLNAIFGEW
jgi:hypothetical protein